MKLKIELHHGLFKKKKKLHHGLLFFSPELFSIISINLSNNYVQGAKSVEVFWLGKKKFQVFDDRSLWIIFDVLNQIKFYSIS